MFICSGRPERKFDELGDFKERVMVLHTLFNNPKTLTTLS